MSVLHGKPCCCLASWYAYKCAWPIRKCRYSDKVV